MLVIGIDVIVAPTVTPRLVERFGNVRVLFGGLLAAALAYALFLPVAMDWTYVAMFPTMLLLGLAFSLAYGPLTMAAVEGVDEPEHGLASGLLYTSIQFGTALGISAVTAVSVAALDDPGTTAKDLDAIRAGLIVPVAAAVLAAAVTALGLGRRRTVTGADTPVPAPTPAEVSV